MREAVKVTSKPMFHLSCENCDWTCDVPESGGAEMVYHHINYFSGENRWHVIRSTSYTEFQKEGS